MKKKNTIRNYIFIIPGLPKNSRKKLLRKCEADKICSKKIMHNAQTVETELQFQFAVPLAQ